MGSIVFEPLVGSRARKTVGPFASSPKGRIELPPVEVIEIVDGAPTSPEPAKLRERSGWLWAFLAFGGSRRASRYVLPTRLSPEILRWREDFALLEIDETGRPVLHVLPGMSGELRIGVSRMTVAQMLADPSLQDPQLGGARLPVPFGARIRVECGGRTFVARVGGPPLMQILHAAPATSQLAHA
jgi:hypothetical protein